MYFYIHAKNVSERIFHVASQETTRRSNTLKKEELADGHALMSLRCKHRDELDSLIETFMTDRNFRLQKVYSNLGSPIDRRLPIGEAYDTSRHSRYNLSLIANEDLAKDMLRY